ncbi:MAG: hypothetical protein DSZ24_03415 [Thermodesulfatator sp.]|nr:MAG: hypothetical protein DSZ24_03415 [Thermodesulfatator sp.]
MKKALIILLLLCWALPARALTPQEERQLLRDVAEIKATLRVFMEQTNKRFEEINQRFEDINQRFEEMQRDMDKRFEEMQRYSDKRFEEMQRYSDKRFEEINHRFDQLYTFLWIVTGIFTSITVAVIAFALWDRRTIISRAREEAVERIIPALREYAREEPRLQEILRRYGLA